MRVLLFALALFCAMPSHAEKFLKVGKMLDAVLVTGAGSTFGPAESGRKSFQAVVTGSGSVSATVVVQASNDATTQGWATLGTITLSGTTTATDGFASQGSWAYYRGNVTAVSGTSAAVTLTVAEE